MANVHYRQGNYDEAMRLYDRQDSMKGGPDHAVIVATHAMADVHESQGNYDEAMRLYDQALKIK